MRRRLPIVASLVVASASLAFAQVPDEKPRSPVYGLEGGKLAVAVAVSAHQIAVDVYDETIGADTTWRDSADLAVIAGFRCGLNRRFAAQADVSISDYDNDMYWRPEVPHNPYYASGILLTASAGIRFDFRNPGARVRPYLGGGLIAARYTDVSRGPTEFCLSEVCSQMAPELFSGTKWSWYIDCVVIFFVNPRWGVATGVKGFPLPGSGTQPAGPAEKPTGLDTFGHYQMYAGIVYHFM